MQKLSFLTRKIDVQTSNSLKLDAWLSMSHCCYYWSVTKPCPTLSDPMDWGFPVLHYLLELAQTHFHWVDDAIQPSHPLLPSSTPTLSLFQHQGLFQWISSSHHCLHTRRSLTPLLKLHKNPEIQVSTGEEPFWSGLNYRWGTRSMHRLERNP